MLQKISGRITITILASVRIATFVQGVLKYFHNKHVFESGHYLENLSAQNAFAVHQYSGELSELHVGHISAKCKGASVADHYVALESVK